MLTNDEYNDLKSQIGTSRFNHSGVRKLPWAFTEQGVAMLATVIHTKVATQVSINIMRTFVKMRHFIIENKDVYQSLNNINNTLFEHSKKIDYFFSKFDKKEKLLSKDKPFSAYKTILEILNNATSEITFVDNYADLSFLDLIRHIKYNIILITKDSDRLSNIEIEKYNKEYQNLKVIRNNSFHDRYIIIDNKDVYLCGASINNIGSKTSTIVKLDDNILKDTLLKIINNIKKISHN